jgi:hypothetical protein
MAFRVDSLERRCLLAFVLPAELFAQPDDTYSLSILSVPGVEELPLRSLGWSVTRNSGQPQAGNFQISLASGPISPEFFRLAMTGQNQQEAVIEGRASDGTLRNVWELRSVRVAAFEQSIGSNGILEDALALSFSRIIVTDELSSTEVDWNVATQTANQPAIKHTGWMSSSPDVLHTMEFGAGQLPLRSYDFGSAGNLPTGPAFETVASVAGVGLLGRVVRASNATIDGTFTARNPSDATPALRTRFIGMRPATYSFADVVGDAEPRHESFTYTTTQATVQQIGYSYDAAGTMQPPTSYGWNYATQVPANPANRTAHIAPPTFGPRNTPLEEITIQFSSPQPGLTLGHFDFDNLNPAGVTLTTLDGGLNWKLGKLAPAQTADGDYGIKLFAMGSGLADFVGSTGIHWTLDTVAPSVVGNTFLYEIEHALDIHFSEDVSASLAADDFTVTNLGNGQVIPPALMSLQLTSGGAIVRFPGLPGGRLPDGDYRLDLANISDPAGNTVASAPPLNFHVLAGDLNRDRAVNFDDLLLLAQNYGQTGRTFSQGNIDYSADGMVGFDDLLILAQRYGQTMMRAAPITPKTRTSAAQDVLA